MLDRSITYGRKLRNIKQKHSLWFECEVCLWQSEKSGNKVVGKPTTHRCRRIGLRIWGFTNCDFKLPEETRFIADNHLAWIPKYTQTHSHTTLWVDDYRCTIVGASFGHRCCSFNYNDQSMQFIFIGFYLNRFE